MSNNQINLNVKSANGTLYDGPAYAVSSINNVGEFDILPDHGNFITKIEKHLTIHIEKGKKDQSKDYKIKSGLLRCNDNQVDVYLGIDSL